MIKQLFLDTETTGLSRESGLYQIGGIIRYEGVYEEFELNCDIFEDDEVNTDAMEMAKMSVADLAKLPDPGDTYSKLIEILGRHVDKFDKTDKFFIIGYGVEFDVKALRRWFEGMGDQYFGSWFWMPWICVMTLAGQQMMNIRPTMPNFKLLTVLKYNGIEFDEDRLHGALYDAKKAMELYDKITNMGPVDSRNFKTLSDGRKIYKLKK